MSYEVQGEIAPTPERENSIKKYDFRKIYPGGRQPYLYHKKT